ncbi:hypothetical protein [Streptomyces sp. NPDC020742]
MTAMAHEPMATDHETLLDYFLALTSPGGKGLCCAPATGRIT